MDSKKAKIAIIDNGKVKTLQEWNKADALFFCEVLQRERTDLYDYVREVLQKMNSVQKDAIGYCLEPMPEGYGKCKQEIRKKPSFNSILNEHDLKQLADLSNEFGVFTETKKVGFNKKP